MSVRCLNVRDVRLINVVFAWGLCCSILLPADETPVGKEPAVAVPAVESLKLVRSQVSGQWSDPATWEGEKLPEPGESVQIRPGHVVTYDIRTETPFRAVHVGGCLEFSRSESTRLDCGLIRIQSGEEVSEEGFDCDLHVAHAGDHDAHHAPADPVQPRAGLIVGTAENPIPSGIQAVIRLHYVGGMDPKSCPAIVCCGGRMDFHGAPLSRTWVKLGAGVKTGDAELQLAEQVEGWQPGDKVLVVSTDRLYLFGEGRALIPTVRDKTQSEERIIKSIEGDRILLDQSLAYAHRAEGDFRGEVANLSRNVLVESADPQGVRGHTMYHLDSAGSISYAEFRHLGKKDELGRYSLHYHLCRESMRGSSVIGASIHDSDNRWLTVHGTDYLVVRDCVGYNSIGHGFFLEDGTEVFNVFDRNLAVQARHGKPLPKQVLPFDENEGAGFWWSNSLNTWTRNVSAECDQYGYRFEAAEHPDFSMEQQVPQPDGSLKKVDIRTLPFVRFEANESHTQRRFALNLGGIRHVSDEEDYRQIRATRSHQQYDLARIQGGDVNGIGPDYQHPFMIRNFKVWNSQWVFHGGSPNVLIDGLEAVDCTYGIFKTRSDGHEYRNLTMKNIDTAAIFQPWGSSNIKENYFRYVDDAFDDLPPTSVVTSARLLEGNRLRLSGTTADNHRNSTLKINDKDVAASLGEFGEWEATIELPQDATTWEGTVVATDAKGNVESRPQLVRWTASEGLELDAPHAPEHALTPGHESQQN